MLEFVRRKARWIASGAAVALAACTASNAQEAAPRPALWKVADEDTTIYLFGTMHLLPKGLDWRTPAIEQAIGASDTLVMEILNPEDPNVIAPQMMSLAVSPDLPPVVDRVPADKRAALEQAIAASGIPGPVLDRLETWAVALAIITGSFQKLGLDPKLGAEESLLATYKGAGKKLEALETVDQQLGLFDTLPEDAQRLLLQSAVEDSTRADAEFKAMVDAWARGDVEAIARVFDDETSLSPQLRDVLMRKRNANWTEWLDKRMDQPGTVMVAVGAGHLAGQDSVQKMLEARGFKAERVQ